jgi:tryptophan-rich sensory protein
MKWLSLLFSILLAHSAGLLGSLTTITGAGSWYQTLVQPAFAPPSWVFGPVWFTLYTLMGIAAWMIWLQRKKKASRFALWVYLFQLVLNSVWSLLFFGLQRPDLALVEIAILLGMIIATIVLFWRIDTRAGALLIPYALWVSFATLLTTFIVVLN